VVKVSVTPDITHDSVAEHLGKSVEGTSVPFDDESLSAIADIGKIRKAYKLGAAPAASAKAPSAQVNGTTDGGKRELEINILGAMALRGAA